MFRGANDSAAMPAIVRLALLVTFCSSLLLAQRERRPEAFQIALGMQQRGLHEEASGYLTKFLDGHPQHRLAPEAWYRLAQCREELGQVDAAIAALGKALASGGADFPLRAEALYRLGNLRQGKGDAERAREAFATLVEELDGAHYLAAAASYAVGEALRDLSKDEAAADAFARAAEFAKGEQRSFRFPACYQLGFCRLRLQQFERAAAAFEAAFSAATDDAAKAECRYLIGDALLRLERFEQAGAAFARVLQLGGEFADDAQYGLGWVALGQGDRAAALAAFARLLQRYPDSPFAAGARLERARCLYQNEDYQGALQEIEPLLADGHALAREARELQGLCALASGAGAVAVDTLQRALADADEADKPRLAFALGEALAGLKRWPEALRAYRQVPAAAGAELYGDALYGACHALHELGRHEDSIVAAEAVCALEPKHRTRSLARLAIAENRFALQQYERCEPIYRELLKAGEHRETAAWKLAWCRYLRGARREAADRFRTIAADPQGVHAEEALFMQALALYEAGERGQALAEADRYRARYHEGRFLDRTERIAARVLRQQGDYGAARRRLERAAAIARTHGAADTANADLAAQADLAYQQGDFAAADELFGRLAGLDDAVGARALAGRAWCAFELDDDDACLEFLAQARRHPAAGEELAGLLELESAVQHRRQDWPAAIAAARTFLERFADHPKAPSLRYALGVALARAGQQEPARKVFTELLASGTYADVDRLRYELAWACRRSGDDDEALRQFAAVASSSDDPELAGEARLFLGTALLAEDPPQLAEATEVLEAVHGSHRAQALYRLAFAEFQATDGDRRLWTKARDHFAAIATEGGALLGEALYLGAECCRRLGDYKAAVERAARLLRELPEHERAQRARLCLGECALLAGTPDAAVAPLERFLREHDATGDEVARADAARANLWLGRARLARRQHEQAERRFVRATELSDGPVGAEAQFRLGESRRLRQDLNGAADAFVKLPILYGDATWVRRGLLEAGRTYMRLKQPNKARRFYQELLDEHAGSEEARAAATENPTR